MASKQKELTVYDFAKHCMRDAEFNKGGVPKNERKYLDAIGFEYSVKDGCLYGCGEDLGKFFEAMTTLQTLNEKYMRKQNGG